MIGHIEKTTMSRYNGEEYTLLTPDILEEFSFVNVGKSTFENFTEMNYWVRNGICLFYNTPINNTHQDSFLIGYAEVRQGKYVAVAFRWIDSMEDLIKIYESIINNKIN